jgi:hypothetical protein
LPAGAFEAPAPLSSIKAPLMPSLDGGIVIIVGGIRIIKRI